MACAAERATEAVAVAAVAIVAEEGLAEGVVAVARVAPAEEAVSTVTAVRQVTASARRRVGIRLNVLLSTRTSR
jgi:hypothetical protein